MSLENYLAVMQERMPHSLAHSILRGYGYKVGQTFSSTIERLSNHPEISSAGDSISLHKTVQDHILFGNKCFSVHKIASWGHTPSSENCEMKLKSFLFPRLWEARNSCGEIPELCLTVSDGDDAIFVYVSKREASYSEKVDADYIKESFLKDNKSITKIVAYMKKKYVAYDVVIMKRSENLMIVCLDLRYGFDPKGADQMHMEFVSKFSGSWSVVAHPVNVFPSVDGIYKSDVGRVVEMSFMIGDEAVKHELMRRRKGEDLRTETYHVGGKERSKGELNPFKISVELSLRNYGSESTNSEFTIWGNRSLIGDGELYSVFCSNVVSKTAILTIVNFIISHNDVDNAINDRISVEEGVNEILRYVSAHTRNRYSLAELMSAVRSMEQRDAIISIYRLCGYNGILREEFEFIRDDGASYYLEPDDVHAAMVLGEIEIDGSTYKNAGNNIIPFYTIIREAIH